MTANGARLFVESTRDDFYKQLGYDPHLPRAYEPPSGEIPIWLTPLAGDLPNFPPDKAVIQVYLESDAQVIAFCQVAKRLKNLEDLGVGGVSASGMELLRKHLPQLPRLVEVSVNNDTDLPDNWLASLTNVRSLSVWAEGKRMGSPLAAEHLRDIARLPQLEVLLIFGYSVDDASIQALSESTSLRHLVLRYSKVTEAGEQQLSKAMPECDIRGEWKK